MEVKPVEVSPEDTMMIEVFKENLAKHLLAPPNCPEAAAFFIKLEAALKEVEGTE